MNETNPLAVGLVVVALVAVWAMVGPNIVRRAGQLRRMRRASTTIAAVQPGQVVTIAGTMVGPVIASPLTQQPCGYWKVQVQELRHGSGNTNDHWKTIFEQTSTTPFTVADATGHLDVLPERADTTLLDDSHSTVDLGGLTQTRLAQLQQLGMPAPKSSLMGKAKHYVVQEYCVLRDDAVVVVGYAECTPTSTIQLRTHGRQTLLLLNQEPGAAHATLRRQLLLGGGFLLVFTLALYIALFFVTR